MITLTTAIVKKEAVLDSNIDGEVVMMNLDSDSYYGMNSVGSSIWNIIDKPITVTEICQKLLDEFEVSESACQQEVVAFIEKMIHEKLVSIVDA